MAPVSCYLLAATIGADTAASTPSKPEIRFPRPFFDLIRFAELPVTASPHSSPLRTRRTDGSARTRGPLQSYVFVIILHHYTD